MRIELKPFRALVSRLCGAVRSCHGLGLRSASMCAGLCVSSTAMASPPYHGKYLRDLDTAWIHEERLDLGPLEVHFTVSVEKGAPELLEALPVSEIRHHIRKSYDNLQIYMARHGAKVESCRSDYQLHIFVISYREMNEVGRFEQFRREKGLEGRKIYGFYDSTPEIRGHNNMILTDVSPYENPLTLQHELFHHWWDRACLSLHLDGSGELHAVRFETMDRP